MGATKAVKKKHWYFITYSYCVLCSAGETYRTRMYTEKPKEWDKRHEWIDFACDSQLM
jgi:hypothetical protein